MTAECAMVRESAYAMLSPAEQAEMPTFLLSPSVALMKDMAAAVTGMADAILATSFAFKTAIEAAHG